MNKQRVLNLLGLAAKGRMVTAGTDFVIKQMAVSKSIVFLADDSGDNIKKKIRNKAKTFEAILIEEFTTDELSKAIGKSNRKVVLVADKGFIKKFTEYINS